MKLHRFIGEYDLSKKDVEITDSQTIKQIKTVLRLEEGELIILSDGKGTEAEVVIASLSKGEIIGNIKSKNITNGSERKVNLYIAILKKENFELIAQKAVECGVSNIIPVITERTIKTGLNTDRLQKIIREASEQCGQNIIPTLFPTMNFKDALKDGELSDEKIIFQPSEKQYTPNIQAKNISIFIGPEGGFTEKEILLAQESGYNIASLGPLILRGETAAIVATYRAVYAI